MKKSEGLQEMKFDQGIEDLIFGNRNNDYCELSTLINFVDL